MDNFKFTKSIVNNGPATTNSKLIQMNDLDRIQRIHDNMGTMFNANKPKEPIQTVKQDNTDMFKNRINALNNIKKD